jgi:hypothetical protein
MQVEVGLGTARGLADIVSMTTVTKDAREHVFGNLVGLLKEKQAYFVTLRALNQAGLTGQTPLIEPQ